MKIKLFLIFILFCSFAWADAVNLSEHGKDLMRANFAIRYSFAKTTHKDWFHSTYIERKEFLTKWYQQQAREAKQDQAKAREQAAGERERAIEKRQEKHQEEARIRARQQEVRAAEKEVQDRNKSFNQAVRDEQRSIDQLRSQQRTSGM